MSDGIELIKDQLRRHAEVEGWMPDATAADRSQGQMAVAAAVYAFHAYDLQNDEFCYGDDCTISHFFPWGGRWWRPSDNPVCDLARAGALIAAEINRLQREARDE